MPTKHLLPVLLLFLGGAYACKPYEDMRGPVSGVKVVSPTGSEITIVDENDKPKLIFSGLCLDEKGVTDVTFGVQTKYYPWEGTNAAFNVDSMRRASLVGTAPTFTDTIRTDADWPQGRYLLYSYATNVDGDRSDSNLAFKSVRNRAYPLLAISQPAVNNTFTTFYAGQNVVVAGRVAHVTADPVEVTCQPCLLHNDGSLNCNYGSSVSFRGIASDTSFRDTVEMPLNAQAGQLFRIKISARVLATEKEYYLAPGFQLRAQ